MSPKRNVIVLQADSANVFNVRRKQYQVCKQLKICFHWTLLEVLVVLKAVAFVVGETVLEISKMLM